MYHAVELVEDKDLHHFVWRRDPDKPLQDYRMTPVTFGVSTSSLANMSVKQNALDHALNCPLVANAVHRSYIDGLTGADSTDEATELHTTPRFVCPRGIFVT